MRDTQRAFTLVETLVAISIIGVAITGPFYAVQQALNASRSARDQLIATSLAQEGVEYVRGLRDGNYLYVLNHPGSSRSWLYGVDGTNSSKNCITNDCYVDATQSTLALGVKTVSAPLYLSATHLYNQQSSGTATAFTRKVRLTAVSGSTTEMIVTVTVSWKTKTVPYTVVVDEHLHNWL